MNWLVDTSAWGRIHREASAREQVRALLDADPDAELVLSPAVELELLRGPRTGAEVTQARAELETAYQVLAADTRTFQLAADAMQAPAEHQTDARRLPVVDLITAALAHQHGCGVIHFDDDYELLVAHAGLDFPTHRLTGTASAVPAPSPAARQRALKKELHRLVSQLPVDGAERFLEDAVERPGRRSVAPCPLGRADPERR